MVNNTLQLFVYKNLGNCEIDISPWAVMGVATECVTCANNDPRFCWVYTNGDDLETELWHSYLWDLDRIKCDDGDNGSDPDYNHVPVRPEHAQLIKKLVSRIDDPERRAECEQNLARGASEIGLPEFCLRTDALVNKSDFPEIVFAEGIEMIIVPFYDNPRYQVCFYPRENTWMFVVDVETMEIKSGVYVPMADIDTDNPMWYVGRSHMVIEGRFSESLGVSYDEKGIHHPFIKYTNEMHKEDNMSESNRAKYVKAFGGDDVSVRVGAKMQCVTSLER